MNLLFATLLIGTVYVSVRKLGGDVRSGRGSRADGEAYYYALRKELGIDPYSPAELAQMDAEERYTHDRNARSAAFWTDSKTYVDYDGKVRQL